jgi:nucleotide-binding universal stress UspA family protein
VRLLRSRARSVVPGAESTCAHHDKASTRSATESTIGVAYVDSEEGREALRGAHALAQRVGARLRVLTVVGVTLAMYAETEAQTAARRAKRLEDVLGEHKVEAMQAAQRAVAELGLDGNVEVDGFIGDPADVLVDLTPQLDLLVCGSRGYGPLRAVLLGGVSRRVVADARCPVIVLPRGSRVSLEALIADATSTASSAGRPL